MEEFDDVENRLSKRDVYLRVLNQMEIQLSNEYLSTGKIQTENLMKYIKYSDINLGRPIGSRLSMVERLEYYYKVIVNNLEFIHTDYERQLKSKLKSRVRKRVESMKNPIFFTQTFCDEKIPDNANHYIHYWRQVFSNSGIENWVLVSDYGADYHRLHFHGFLDLPDDEYDELIKGYDDVKDDKKSEVATPHFRIDKVLTKKLRYRVVITYVPFSSYGYNSVLILNDNTIDVNTSINYCTKYLLKDMEELGYKHEVFGSRKKTSNERFEKA